MAISKEPVEETGSSETQTATEKKAAAHRAHCKTYRNKHKAEIAESGAAYYQAHQDEILKDKKEYRQQHKTEAQAWRDAHKTDTADYNSAYYKANREELLKKTKKYKGTHREAVLKKKREWKQKWREAQNAAKRAAADATESGACQNEIAKKLLECLRVPCKIASEQDALLLYEDECANGDYRAAAELANARLGKKMTHCAAVHAYLEDFARCDYKSAIDDAGKYELGDPLVLLAKTEMARTLEKLPKQNGTSCAKGATDALGRACASGQTPFLENQELLRNECSAFIEDCLRQYAPAHVLEKAQELPISEEELAPKRSYKVHNEELGKGDARIAANLYIGYLLRCSFDAAENMAKERNMSETQRNAALDIAYKTLLASAPKNAKKLENRYVLNK